jgi:hypothetical protein
LEKRAKAIQAKKDAEERKNDVREISVRWHAFFDQKEKS